MNVIGKRISEARKSKGLTQENLAEKSKINLRTIQRIENNESIPRGQTLDMICNVLQLDSSQFLKDEKLDRFEKHFGEAFFLIIYNLIIIAIFVYLTINPEANINSRFGGFLLSFFLPFFIVYMTQKMNKIERFIKFGFGPIIFLILLLLSKGFAQGFILGFLPCIIIYSSVLYFGEEIITKRS